jgi:predicted lipid-binding transport protein (Tim44 family)
MPVDIIVFAAIAVFLVLKLKSVLGTRPETDDDVQPVPRRAEAPIIDHEPSKPFRAPEGVDAATAEHLHDIAQADPQFDAAEFLNGAKAAFDIIVAAYRSGDAAALKPLVSDQLYNDFTATMGASVPPQRLLSARLHAAKLGGAMAYVTVAFTTEGNAAQNLWTFSRDTRNTDPNWTLIETKTA